MAGKACNVRRQPVNDQELRLADLLINSVRAETRRYILWTRHRRELDTALIGLLRLAASQVLVRPVERALLMGCTRSEPGWPATMPPWRNAGHIGIRGGTMRLSSDVPEEKSACTASIMPSLCTGGRVPQTRWVVLRYPTSAMAQQAGMSTAAFEDFFFTVCTMDYRAMSRAMDALVARMQRTDRVHLVGPGTDLTFSIKGQPAIKCDGKLNIPDGEVFTAPVRDSINGVITFNTPSLYQGVTHENIRLVFRDGRIVEESGSRPTC